MWPAVPMMTDFIQVSVNVCWRTTADCEDTLYGSDAIHGAETFSENEILSINPQLHHGRSAATFILRRLNHRGQMRMRLQELPKCFAQDAHATAMHYAHARHTSQESAVHEPF